MSANIPGILYDSPFFRRVTTIKTDNGFGNPDYPLANLGDMSPVSFYESEGATIAGSTRETIIEIQTNQIYKYDSIAIVGHNLGNVLVNGHLYVTKGATDTPIFDYNFGVALDNTPYMRVVESLLPGIFSNLQTEKVKFRIRHNAPIRIGSIIMGEVLALKQGAYAIGSELPVFDDGIAGTTNESETGLVIGRSVYRRPVPFQISQPRVPGDFARGDWKTFLNWAQYFPWVFSNSVVPTNTINFEESLDPVYAMANIPLTRPRAYAGDSFSCNLDAVSLPVQYERFPNDFDF